MPPGLDEAIDAERKVIREEFGGQLDACARLVDLAFQLMEEIQGRKLESDAQALLLAVFCRTLDTYCAGLRLAADGFGAQAQMLNRSLFEDMVDAHWIATEPDLAIQRYAEHSEHGAMLLADVVGKYPDMWQALDVPEFDPVRRVKLDKLFGPFGAKSWTTLNIHERVNAIEHHWTDEESRRTLHTFRDIAQRDNNETLHLSSASLRAVLDEPKQPGNMQFVSGPRSERVDRALFGGFWTFAQTLGLILDEFGIEMEDDERAETFDMADFVSAADEQSS